MGSPIFSLPTPRLRLINVYASPRCHRVMTSQARTAIQPSNGIEKAPLKLPKGASPSYRCAFSRKMDQLPLSYRLRRASQIPRPATATPAIATPTVSTREVSPVEGGFPPPTGPPGTWGEPGSPGTWGEPGSPGSLRPVIDVLEHGRLAPRGSGAQGTAAVVGERHGHRERPAVIHDVVLDKTARRTLLLRGIGPAHAIRVHGIRGNDLARTAYANSRAREMTPSRSTQAASARSSAV